MYAPNQLDPQIIGEIGHGQGGKGVETAFIRMYEEFYNCVQKNCRPFIKVEQTMAASKVAWLAERSAEKPAQVLWDDI